MRKTVAVVCTLLAGCAASGVRVTDDQLGQLRPGITTEADVVRQFGPATTRMRTAGGEVTLQYVYAEAQIRAASFVPIVGLFAGGSDIRSTMVAITFGTDGKLRGTTSAASQYGTATGVGAGVQPGQVPQQPRQ